MHLILTVENADAFGQPFESSRSLDAGALTIGRGAESDWQLPDTSRFVSARHCRVEARDSRFLVTDLSRNGVTVRGETLGPEESAELRNGDRLVVGPFVLLATVLPGPADAGPADAERTLVAMDADRTVIAMAADRAAPPAKESSAVVDRSVPPEPPRSERPKAAPAKGGRYSSEFVAQFATAAGIDPERLAGRTDIEFSRELGEMMRDLVPALVVLARSAREFRGAVAGDQGRREGILDPLLDESRDVLAALLTGEPGARELTAALVEDVLAHDRAMFPALQAALFRLFNDLAPTTIERRATGGLLRSGKARCWDAYEGAWEDFSRAGHNGIMDVLLSHFRETYGSTRSGG